MRISSTKMRTAISCGKLAKAKIEGMEVPDSWAMKRGREVDQKIIDWFMKDDALLDEWEVLMPPKAEIVSVQDERIVEFEGHTLIAHPDVVAKNAIYEIKTGKIRESYAWQVKFYNRLYGFDIGYIVYLDQGVVAQVNGMMTDDELREGIVNIESGEPRKGFACEFCPLKKDCEVFNGLADDIIKEYIRIKNQIDLISEEIDEFRRNNIRPKEDERTRLIDRATELKNSLSQGFNAGRYEKGVKYSDENSSLSFYKETRNELPVNYIEIAPPDKYPELYEYKPKKKALIEKFGVPISRVNVRINKNKEKE